MEIEIIIEQLKERLKVANAENVKLAAEVERLRKVIVENDLEEELGVKVISLEEQICVDGLMHLSKLFAHGSFVKDDVSSFDVLHKNLRLLRGQDTGEIKKKGKDKPADVKELLRIVETEVKEQENG